MRSGCCLVPRTVHTPHATQTRSPWPVRWRASRSPDLPFRPFCPLHFGAARVSSGLPRSGRQGGSRCAAGVRREGLREPAGERGSCGSLRTSHGGGRRRPGCRESRAVAGLQRGSPGRWGILEPKSHAGGVCLLAGPPKCPVTVREQPGESVAVDKCGGWAIGQGEQGVLRKART